MARHVPDGTFRAAGRQAKLVLGSEEQRATLYPTPRHRQKKLDQPRLELVPPNDPYLRQVDRTLLVPDRTRRQQVWRAVSGPGALLIDGEVAGTWRYRRSDQAVTITPFAGLTSAQRSRAGSSALLVAEAIGDEQPDVSWA